MCDNIDISVYCNIQPLYIVMMSKEASTKIVNFMTPEVGVHVLKCDHISFIVKIQYFFKNLLSSQAQISQTEDIVKQ